MPDGDNEWRFGRVRLLKVEIWVRGGDEKTDDGHTADVEENDTDVDAQFLFICNQTVERRLNGIHSRILDSLRTGGPSLTRCP